MSLFISRVFGDEVEVFATDNKSSVHFRRDNGASEDTPTDRNLTGERTFLICRNRQSFYTKTTVSCQILLGRISA